MAHKVHPKAYRLRNLNDWQSRWLNNRNFAGYLAEDFKIREFFRKKAGNFWIEKVEIERFPGKLNIIVSSARPGLLIGRGGSGIEDLKKELEKQLFKNKKNSSFKEVKIDIREIRDVWSSAALSAQYAAQEIEKRLPYRRVLKQSLSKIMASKGVKGARIEVSGRLNGAAIARREWLQKGNLPRQALRADIDFAVKEAYCTYGTIGVKVWIYKGEQFDDKNKQS